ncbi:hypothetical protein [Agromyces seonyuensis]|uniref:DUF4397 domain-containing protein n=1 Tax=Agromyces seonyuensis TaxID=2662446 RepID=A0A6I4P356_9MICO|nr:hypothetical protein [Agromyces seonyuensis]MWB98589.1 hypothetical protein [Agromyces seonyuensis]
MPRFARPLLVGVAAAALVVAVGTPAAAAPGPVLQVRVVVGDEQLFTDARHQVAIDVYAADDPSTPVQTFDAGELRTGDPLSADGFSIDLPEGDYKVQAVLDDGSSGWLVDRTNEDDVILEELMHSGFRAAESFADATVVHFDATGDSDLAQGLVAVHPEPNSILGGVYDGGGDVFGLDADARMEVYPVGADLPVAIAEADEDARALLVGGLAPGDYQVRFTGTRTTTPEGGDPFDEPMEQWWPLGPSRADAQTVTIPQGGGHWTGITGNLDVGADVGIDLLAEITGNPAVDDVVRLEPTGSFIDNPDLDPAVEPWILEHDVQIGAVDWFADGVPIVGRHGRELHVPPSAEGAVLTAEYAISAIMGWATSVGTTAPTAPVGPSTSRPMTTAPVSTLAGTPAVGQKLTATLGTWSPGGTTRTREWLRDGVPIPDAPDANTYLLTADDLGAEISVRVTAAKPGWATTARTSDPLGPVDAGELVPATPRIAGGAAPRVGTALSANPGTWKPAPVDLSYRWLRDGAPIDGATGAAYTPTETDLGALLSLEVSGAKAGFESDSRTVAAAEPTAAGRLTGTKPAILGTPKVGQSLSIDPGAWMPAASQLEIQWLRAGAPIPGATGATYTPTALDVGKALKATVTSSYPGYAAADGSQTLEKTSAATAKVLP